MKVAEGPLYSPHHPRLLPPRRRRQDSPPVPLNLPKDQRQSKKLVTQLVVLFGRDDTTSWRPADTDSRSDLGPGHGHVWTVEFHLSYIAYAEYT